MGELFLYLGRLEHPAGALHTFLYIAQPSSEHTPAETLEGAAAEIYDLLIHETRIKQGDTCITFIQKGPGQEITPVQVTHERFPHFQFKHPEDLHTIWHQVMTSPRTPPYQVVSVIVINNSRNDRMILRSNILPDLPGLMETLKELAGEDEHGLSAFKPIVQYRCTKAIPYLPIV
jgi:hypothetical protein